MARAPTECVVGANGGEARALHSCSSKAIMRALLESPHVDDYDAELAGSLPSHDDSAVVRYLLWLMTAMLCASVIGPLAVLYSLSAGGG